MTTGSCWPTAWICITPIMTFGRPYSCSLPPASSVTMGMSLAILPMGCCSGGSCATSASASVSRFWFSGWLKSVIVSLRMSFAFSGVMGGGAAAMVVLIVLQWL